MDYLIVSGATLGSKYTACLAQQDYPRFLPVRLKSRGAWGANTKIKPDAIREGFKRCGTVMWIDADCIVDPPESVPPGDWDVCTLANCHPEHKIKVSAAFLLLRDTENTRTFLAVWDRLNRKHKKDHPALKEALLACDLTIGDMTDWLRGRHWINVLRPERGVHAG